MRKAILTAASVLILAPWNSCAFAHSKSDAPKAAPAPSSSQVVLSQWNDVGRKLIAMAEDFPEDKYDFKPVPGVRSFAEQMLHASNDMYFFTNPAKGQKPPSEENPRRENYKSKAELVAFVKKCVEDGAAAIKSRGDKGMA